MRNAFAEELNKIAKEDHRVVLLSGDIGNRLFDELRNDSPKQFINCGIAEQNMMGVAAGMGLAGLKPVVYTITPFTTTRCLEQIRVDVAYHNSPVTFVGTGSGLSYASLGPTHHSLEDFAILRAIPNLQILAPWDASSLRSLLRKTLADNKPTYIRIGKKGEKQILREDQTPDIGTSVLERKGKEIAIIAVGTVAIEAVNAAEILKNNGVDVSVVLVHTIKPNPVNNIMKLIGESKFIVTVEEHSIIGGFGEMLSSYCQENNIIKKINKLGATDEFMPTVGTQEYARKHFKIDADSIVEVVTNYYSG